MVTNCSAFPRGDRSGVRLMIPGIDPKVDIVFKRLFGTPQWQHLTKALMEAVLDPAPWTGPVDLEFLNPYTEPMAIDDKLSILDIKARDDHGRLFNLEMQIVASASLPQRILYYWSLLYGSQLQRGDDYGLLQPTFSICFVNGRIFPDQETYHQKYRLHNANNTHLLTEDLTIHVLELARFQERLEDLTSPLDLWLYFLKNGATLDADHLPGRLDTPELRQAMEVLKMFSQDEMARELYQGRLKAERDAKMHYMDSQRAQANAAAVQQKFAELDRKYTEIAGQYTQIIKLQAEANVRLSDTELRLSETELRLAETELRLAETEQRLADSEQRRDAMEGQLRRELAQRIQLCQRLLNRSRTADSTLIDCGMTTLQELAEGLESELRQRDAGAT